MFDRLLLLELFDTEKVIDKEIGTVEYSLIYNNFIFTLSIWPSDDRVFLTLSHKKHQFIIYEITLNKVEEIKVDRQVPTTSRLLIFEKATKNCLATVMLKPEISLQCECNHE